MFQGMAQFLEQLPEIMIQVKNAKKLTSHLKIIHGGFSLECKEKQFYVR